MGEDVSLNFGIGPDFCGASQASARRMRERTAVVFQDSLLIDGTVHQNIAFGRQTSTTRKDVEDAAAQAGCRNFIADELPDGFDTKLGGTSSLSVSGGQAQRICIARALCRQPTLLLLDEATSSLDPETEAEILSTIFRLRTDHPDQFRDLIVLSITHHRDALLHADLLVRMESGTVVEVGPVTQALTKSVQQ